MAPWYEIEGPSWEEARKAYLDEFKDGHDQAVVAACVRDYMEKKGDRSEKCPFGSTRGFYFGFRGKLKEIQKLIENYTPPEHT